MLKMRTNVVSRCQREQNGSCLLLEVCVTTYRNIGMDMVDIQIKILKLVVE